ncbi:MAG: hypothetical protein ACD_24C00105G0003 [uncultured bacterium]|nr:MAG: hypothetical protein ACD_24C00105G0003 [uncultured bacterium]
MLLSMYTQMGRKKFIKGLLAIYISIFIIGTGLIVAMHATPSSALAVFRIPQNLREVGPELGMTWPTSLRVYHFFLVSFFILVLLNIVALSRLNEQKWRSICRISSFFGILLMWSTALFFVLPLTLDGNFQATNIQTALVYSMLAFGLFIVNLLTFTVAQKTSPTKTK